MVGSHKVAGSSNSRISRWPNGTNSGCYLSHISQNITKSMSMQSHQLVIPCWLSVHSAICRPPSHLWTSDRLKKEVSVKAGCLIFGYSIHMNCHSIFISIGSWWKLNIEVVCKQCTFSNMVIAPDNWEGWHV